MESISEGEDATAAHVGTPRYAEEARRLAGLLPSDVGKPWAFVCRFDLIYNPNRARAAGQKEWQPTAFLSPARKCMIVSSVLRLIAMGSELSPAITDFAGLIERANVERLLLGPLGAMGLITQVIILRGAASMGERALQADVSHILRAARRIEKRAERAFRPGRQRKYDDYWAIALELAPYMEVGDAHDLETAMQSRHAATLGVALELALRRYELAGLRVENVVIDLQAGVVDIVVPARLRKDGDSFTHRLSASIAGLMIDYVHHARPFLVAYGGEETDAVWVSREGGPLCPEGVVSTLRRQVQRRLGVTACCNIFRRANASRNDIHDSETFLYLHQSPRSLIAQEVYAERDRAEGQQVLLAEWNKIAGRS